MPDRNRRYHRSQYAKQRADDRHETKVQIVIMIVVSILVLAPLVYLGLSSHTHHGHAINHVIPNR